MRPVDKGATILGFQNHRQAKPYLIARLGAFCSYCECAKRPQELHVEHIYPRANTSHPNLSHNWRNFLLACNTCNSYKNIVMGSGRQLHLLRDYLWPHIDNTYNAFDYDKKGRVKIRRNLKPKIVQMAKRTIRLVGLINSPAAAKKYAALGIAYDGAKLREEEWKIATVALRVYRENPSASQLQAIKYQSRSNGHFSIWMKVFNNYPLVQRAIIQETQAAQSCFSSTTGQPQPRGRI